MLFKKKLQPYPYKEYPIMQQPALVPTPGQQAQIDRRFGMFLHFSINTFNNTEWSDGKLPIESYCPTAIDADSWVRTAYEAGMNYVIIITKHHDGFCLWDTNTTTYSVNYSPNKTDVVKAVADACKKYGVKLGLSIPYGTDTKNATRMMKTMFSIWKSIYVSLWTADTARLWSFGLTVLGISPAVLGSWTGFTALLKHYSRNAKSV